MYIIKSIWILITMTGPLGTPPGQIVYTFNTKSACVETLRSLKNQRKDVAGYCAEDKQRSYEFNYSSSTIIGTKLEEDIK